MTEARETASPEKAVRDALAAVDAFTDRLNARDAAGMDAQLHFPHIVLADDKLHVVERAGLLPPNYFTDMAAATGWDRNVYLAKRPVMVGPRKVHVLIDYTRNRADGSIIARHQNLWIVTHSNARWGILLRSS